MSQSPRELASVIAYMRSHWPSKVKPKWQVTEQDYARILPDVLQDFTQGATKHHQLIRIAGISGSGKTTQILPAVEAYSSKRQYHPILIAARRFVIYHPHYQEIKDYYGEADLRKHTDEFATIMLFLVISELIQQGYDIILDVTLLDPAIEAILLELTIKAHYDMMLLMIAVSPTVTEHFLAGRAWRHSQETEREFIQATAKALEFYATKAPDLRIILWSVYDQDPVYDGPISQALDTFSDYSSRQDLPKPDDALRRAAKISYLTADSD